MTDAQLQNALLAWSDKAINNPATVGTCTFTNGSDQVAGTNFITGAVIQADGYIKIDANNTYYQVESVDSEIALTLYDNYTDGTETGNSSYSDIGLPIIHGEQAAPKPSDTHLVIHQPINVNKIGWAAVGYSDANGDTDIVSNWEASVTFEIRGLLTDYLRTLLDSVEKQSIREYLRSLNISFMRHENIAPTPDMTENKWRLGASVDIFILYPHGTEEETSFIEDVEYTNNIL